MPLKIMEAEPGSQEPRKMQIAAQCIAVHCASHIVHKKQLFRIVHKKTTFWGGSIYKLLIFMRDHEN